MAGANGPARQRPLEDLLQIFWDEADPSLRPGYIPIDDIARRLDRSPSRDELIAALRAAGHAACRSHVETKALKTGARAEEVAAVAARDCGYRLVGGGGGARV